VEIAEKKGRATIDDLLAIPEEDRFHELISGEIVRKASPSGEHGGAQAGVIAAIGASFQRPPGRGGPGGWWFASETELVTQAGDVLRPDIAGWRRERVPERPTGFPITVRPDWVCEIVSPSHASRDTVTKLRLYHREAVPHYWLVDPRAATLTVLRWQEPGYLTALAAERGERVRAEPFDAIELEVAVLLGDDPSE
jgi:Uma2 family endonuclease